MCNSGPNSLPQASTPWSWEFCSRLPPSEGFGVLAKRCFLNLDSLYESTLGIPASSNLRDHRGKCGRNCIMVVHVVVSLKDFRVPQNMDADQWPLERERKLSGANRRQEGHTAILIVVSSSWESQHAAGNWDLNPVLFTINFIGFIPIQEYRTRHLPAICIDPFSSFQASHRACSQVDTSCRHSGRCKEDKMWPINFRMQKTGRKQHRDWIKYLVGLKLMYTLSQHLVTKVRTAAAAKLCIYLTSCYLQQPICNAAQALSLWHSLLVQVFSLVVALVIEHLRFRTFAPGTKRVESRTNTQSLDCWLPH